MSLNEVFLKLWVGQLEWYPFMRGVCLYANSCGRVVHWSIACGIINTIDKIIIIISHITVYIA